MASRSAQSDGARPIYDGPRWRVFIVDDHPLYRDALREVLENQLGLIVTGEAESEDDAFQHILASKPDLVTVDVSLATGNGLSLISRVKQRALPLHVIVVSMHGDRAYADLALAAGASGYVTKYAARDELLLSLETIRKGEVYVSPQIHQSSIGTAPANPSGKTLKQKHLSSRELQILTMIGQGRNTQQIATELGLAVSTVETYRERLKTKLNLSSGADLVRHAIFWEVQRRSLPSGSTTAADHHRRHNESAPSHRLLGQVPDETAT
jgi:DNA-binding NarL/FixJ family response regulator